MISDSARLAHFLALDVAGQVQAIKRLAILGYTPDDISRAIGWSVEAVRLALGRPAREGGERRE